MRTHPPLLRTAIAALIVSSAACWKGRDAIVVREGMLVIENQSGREWRNVRVTINDHYSGGAPLLSPGGRLTAPLRDFQSGFGHRFEVGRMPVKKVKVSAIDDAGQPVALSWESRR